MNRFQRIRRSAAVLAGLVGSLLAFVAVAPAVFAMPVPPDPGDAGLVQAPPSFVQIHTVATGGMPGWQIILIAVGAALFAAAAAVLLDRARLARRHVTATAS